MNTYQPNITRKNKRNVFVATFLIVIGSGSIADIFLTKWLMIFSLVILLLIYSSYKSAFSKIFVISFATILLLLLLNFIASPFKDINNYLQLLTKSVNALLFVFIIGKNDYQLVITTFKKILYLFLIYGLINYFIYPFIESNLFLIQTEYQTFNTFNYLFYYGDRFTEQYDFFGLTFSRNAGFFWEPGVNQFYLNLLLFIELNLFKKINKKLVFLTIFSLLITYSTTGVIILGIQLFLSRSTKSIPIIIKIILFLLSLVILYFSITYVSFQKIQTYSFAVRALDLFQTFEIFKDNLFFGIGINIDYFISLREFYDVNYEFINSRTDINKGNSNSIMSLLLSFGLPLGGWLIIRLYKQKIFLKEKLIFSLILFLTLFASPLIFKPLFLAFIISASILSQNKTTKYLY